MNRWWSILVFHLVLLIVNHQCAGVYQEQPCANRGGTCQDKSDCGGSTLRGLCPTQPRDVLCCLSDGAEEGTSTGNNCGCSYDYATSPTSGPAPGARRLGNYFKKRYGGRFEIYNNRNVRGSNTLSLHAEGRAVDLYVSDQNGQNAFDHAVSIACSSGIQEVIFNSRIWTRSRGNHHYSGSNPHTDHVHIGLNRCGARNFNRQ